MVKYFSNHTLWITPWSWYLDGLIMPEAFLRIVSFVLLAVLIPKMPRAAARMFNAVFGRVGKALLPTNESASIVKFFNLTSTVGSLIPTLQLEENQLDID